MAQQRRASMSAMPHHHHHHQGGHHHNHVATFHAPLTTTEDYYDQETNNNNTTTTTIMADMNDNGLVNTINNSENDRHWWQFGGGGSSNINNNNSQQRRRASVSSDGRLSSTGNLSASDLNFGHHHPHHHQHQQGRHNNNSSNNNNGVNPWWAFASFKSTAATASSDLEASNNSNRQYHHHHQQQHNEILIDFPTKQRRPRKNHHIIDTDTTTNDNSTPCSIGHANNINTNTPQHEHLDDYNIDDHRDNSGGGDYGGYNSCNQHCNNHQTNNNDTNDPLLSDDNDNAQSSMRRTSDSDDNRSWWSFADDNDEDDNNPCNANDNHENYYSNDNYKNKNNKSNNNSNHRNNYHEERQFSNSTNTGMSMSFNSGYNSDTNEYNYNTPGGGSTTNTGMSLYRDIVSKEFIKRNSDDARHVKQGDIVGYVSCKSLDGLVDDDDDNNEIGDNDDTCHDDNEIGDTCDDDNEIGDNDGNDEFGEYKEDDLGEKEEGNDTIAAKDERITSEYTINNKTNKEDSRRFSTECQQDSDEEQEEQEGQCCNNEEENTPDNNSEERLSIININPQQRELLARQLTNASEVLDKALDSFRELERSCSYSDDDEDENENDKNNESSPARNKWMDHNPRSKSPQSSANPQSNGLNPTTTTASQHKWNGEHTNEGFLYDYSDSDNGTHHVGTIKAHGSQDEDHDDDDDDSATAEDNDGDSSIEMGEPTYPIQIIDDSLRGNEADPETDYACGYSDTDLRKSCTRIQDKLLSNKQNDKPRGDTTTNGEEEGEEEGGSEDSEHELHQRGLWRFSQPDAVSSVDREKCQEMLEEAELEQCQKEEEEEFLKKCKEENDGSCKQQQQQQHQYPESEEGGGGECETGGGDVSGSEWDSARLFEIKEGVSLSKVTVLDDVSSIDSSEHSGKIPFRIFRRTSSERAVGGKSFFGWNKQQGPPTSEAEYIYSGHHVVSSDVGAEYGGSEGYSKTGGGESSKGGKLSWFSGSNNKDNNTPPTTTISNEKEGGGGGGGGQPTSPSTPPKKNKQKSSSHRSSHGKWSLSSSLGWNSQSKTAKTRKLQKRMSSLDEDDDELDNSEDDDDACLENDIYSKQDARHRKVVKEACTIMGSVNKSTVTMGMEAPFCPADEMFPPMKKLHLNLGYQMDSLQAAIGNSRSSRHRARELKKAVKKNKGKSSNSLSSSLESSDQPPPPPSLMNDHKALTAYIMEQVTMMQQQQHQKTATILEPSGSRSLAMIYTAFLPNFMYFQAIAADSSSSMRPTSLCSGTGITGDEQYLQPDMLNVFSTFGSYFLGSGHLFQEESEATSTTLVTSTPNTVKSKSSSKGNNARRSAFWVETIHEQDSMSDNDGASSKSNSSSDDDSSSDGSSIGSDSKQVQNDLLEKVIADLRASQMMMEQPGARVMSNYEIRDKSMIKSSVWE